MNEKKVLDAAMIEQLLALLPGEQQLKLFTLMMDESVSDEQLEEAVGEAVSGIDFSGQEEQIRALISMIMPLETLVPEIYGEWRAVIRDAVAFVGSQLSPKRLVPKLIEQMMLPEEMPLEERLIILVSQMPSLQKIGQIVARNPHLEPSFRAQLTRLENEIENITAADVLAEIKRQLEGELNRYQVQIEEPILAEASVSAVMRFTWLNPSTQRREEGVFKVLKPYIVQYFDEEMKILQGVAGFFDQNRENYDLPLVGFGELMDDVRNLLVREVDFAGEQQALGAAYARYADMPGVRVPCLIDPLSTASITAMSFENGVKVTEALRHNKRARNKLTSRMIEALIAVPVFAAEEESFFHADLHAGNLFVDEETNELIILDWALVEHFTRSQRRQMMLLTFAIGLRDEVRTYEAIEQLAVQDLANEETNAALVRGHIAHFFATLPPLTMPGFTQTLTLLDKIGLSGITFPAGLMMFRKTLFTLIDVLHSITPDVHIDTVLARYALSLMSKEAPLRMFRLPIDSSTIFRSHLSNYDLTVLALSLPLFGHRLFLQTSQQLTDNGLSQLEETFERLKPPKLVSQGMQRMSKMGSTGINQLLKSLKRRSSQPRSVA